MTDTRFGASLDVHAGFSATGAAGTGCPGPDSHWSAARRGSHVDQPAEVEEEEEEEDRSA